MATGVVAVLTFFLFLFLALSALQRMGTAAAATQGKEKLVIFDTTLRDGTHFDEHIAPVSH